MKILKFAFCLLIVFTITSCFTTPSDNKKPEAMIYFYTNQTAEYTEYESISLSVQSGNVIYSVDRNRALMVMEMGSYTIVNGVITINAGKFQATGLFSDEKIVIGDKEFIRSHGK